MINVLIACEESQRVTLAFREMGFNAFSADIKPPSGGHPEYHVIGDVLKILNPAPICVFCTMDGKRHYISKWDLIIAHPPCTYLSNVANRAHTVKQNSIQHINARTIKRIDAMSFFMQFANADAAHIAIENPIGIMNSAYRKPDQIIQPFYFAENENDVENFVTKTTCLWLKNLPQLHYTVKKRPDNAKLYGVNPNGKVSCWTECVHGAANRSKTFPGIARAFATQWGAYLKKCGEGV